jgi:GNAT superfamily N-acetyltransferase
MLNIPFVKNPGKQCGQTCMVMALKYYFPERDFTVGQMNELIRHKPGKWTFPMQNAVALDQLGLKAIAYSGKDIPVGHSQTVNFFKKIFGSDYKQLMAKIDLPVHEYFAKIAKDKQIFKVKKHSVKDIRNYVDRGYLVIPAVDANVLCGKTGPYAGHAVLITGMDEKYVWIHDPSGGPNVKYPLEIFEAAYNVPAIDDDILVVFGKKNRNEITIRRATIKDLENILRLTAGLYENEAQNFDTDWNIGWLYGAGKKIIKAGLSDKDCFCLIAEAGGRAVGFLRASLYWDEWMKWKNGKGAEIWDIFVEKRYRSRRIGRRFMEELLSWCEKRKVDYVLANATFANRQAKKFYRELGFFESQTIMEKRITPANGKNKDRV